jgi:hypothetical protein
MPAASSAAGSTVTPAKITVTVAIPAAVASGSKTTLPAVLAAAVAVAAPLLVAGSVAGPGTIHLGVALPGPTTLGGLPDEHPLVYPAQVEHGTGGYREVAVTVWREPPNE